MTVCDSVSSLLGYPNGLKHNLEHNSCATGDEVHAQFFALQIF